MRIALMQPYFFPYIGYFQLLAETDKFIFYDDVNFIKNGWINRNRLLRNGEPAFFTVPLANASSFAKINEVKVDDKQPWRTKLQQTLLHAYKRAPHYEAVSALFAGVLDTPESSVAAIAKSSVCAIARYLNLPAIMTDTDRKSTRLNSSHSTLSRMPSSA